MRNIFGIHINANSNHDCAVRHIAPKKREEKGAFEFKPGFVKV